MNQQVYGDLTAAIGDIRPKFASEFGGGVNTFPNVCDNAF